MTPETYVIGSIVLSVIVVAILYHSGDESIDNSLRCPRCGAQMQDVGSGVGCVVPPILVVMCSQCGYSERSWAC